MEHISVVSSGNLNTKKPLKGLPVSLSEAVGFMLHAVSKLKICFQVLILFYALSYM